MRWILLPIFFLFFSPLLARDFRCAVVDMTKVFNEYPGTEKAKDKLTKWENKKSDDLKELYQDLNDLNQEVNDKGSKISVKLKEKKQKDLEQKFADYKQKEAQYKNEAMEKENEMTLALVEEIKPIVAEIAKSKDVDLVLDSSKVIYNSSQVDLTKDILERFKKMKDEPDSKK